MIRVFIIDDNNVMMEGIEFLLNEAPNISLVGSAMTAEDGILELANVESDVLLLDINLPEMKGPEACKIIHAQFPNLKILALSMLNESNIIKLMLKNGAAGYLLKNINKQELITAIEEVYNGNRYINKEVTDILLDAISKKKYSGSRSSEFILSRREKEVLELIVEENTTKEISEKLFISFGTVETHRKNLLVKLKVRNTAGLVRTAVEYGLV